MYFQNTVQAGDLQAIYYNFVCSFKKNFVIKRLICRCEDLLLYWFNLYVSMRFTGKKAKKFGIKKLQRILITTTHCQ